MNGQPLRIVAPGFLVATIAFAASCGGGSTSSSQPTSPQTTKPTTVTTGTTTESATQSPNALTVEAQQAAAGDIPDNQVFLTFRNRPGGYSMKYPEGWAQQGKGGLVTFRDKNNLVRVTVVKGPAPSAAAAASDMKRLRQRTPSLRFDTPTTLTLSGKSVVKVVYSTESAPNPVTGKKVRLVVDRYYIPGSGRHAVVDLGTPQGVDNVDAYRLMIESFRWR